MCWSVQGSQAWSRVIKPVDWSTWWLKWPSLVCTFNPYHPKQFCIWHESVVFESSVKTDWSCINNAQINPSVTKTNLLDILIVVYSLFSGSWFFCLTKQMLLFDRWLKNHWLRVGLDIKWLNRNDGLKTTMNISKRLVNLTKWPENLPSVWQGLMTGNDGSLMCYFIVLMQDCEVKGNPCWEVYVFIQ